MEQNERMAMLENTLERISHDLYGNGREGFIETVKQQLSEATNMVSQRHAENQKAIGDLRSRVMLVGVFILGIMVGLGIITSSQINDIKGLVERAAVIAK